MWDTRDHGRDRSDRSFDRHWGSRGSSESRERDASADPRDALLRDLDLPRGRDREWVMVRERTYRLDGQESRALTTIGAFRVVHVSDLREPRETRDRAVRRLEDQGLVRTVPLDGRDRDVVVLTKEGRQLLESHRRDDLGERRQQTFWHGLAKPREVSHDAAIYRAYRRAERRLRDEGARLERVVLDAELKREYQEFLQAANRGDPHSDGRPDRDAEEIEEWAREHDLPYFDDQVHFPDVRLEYEDAEGRHRHEDLEVVTPHYRGGHGASARQSGFTCSFSFGSRSGGRGRGPNPRLAEDLL